MSCVRVRFSLLYLPTSFGATLLSCLCRLVGLHKWGGLFVPAHLSCASCRFKVQSSFFCSSALGTRSWLVCMWQLQGVFLPFVVVSSGWWVGVFFCGRCCVAPGAKEGPWRRTVDKNRYPLGNLPCDKTHEISANARAHTRGAALSPALGRCFFLSMLAHL